MADTGRMTHFAPTDFNSSRYRGMHVINFADRLPVIILASESCDPPRYCVVDGLNEMFYLSYSEVVAYCRRRGYIPVKAP